jgi:hypothetical protein
MAAALSQAHLSFLPTPPVISQNPLQVVFFFWPQVGVDFISYVFRYLGAWCFETEGLRISSLYHHFTIDS